MAALKVLRHALLRLLVLSLVALAGVQFYFVARIALMAVIAPESTAFERSEIYRITKTTGVLPWRQQWMPYAKISVNLQRAVIASEDASFTEHDGLDLEALEKAWEKNAVAQRRAQKIAEQQAAQAARQGKKPPPPVAQALAAKPVKIVGGSTITQQLAKNLFLSGERTLLRKGEELVLTLLLETLLDKQRIAYTVHVDVGPRAEVITREAERLKADRIVIGTARKNSLTRMVEDSVSSKVLDTTSVPVEIVAGEATSSLERVGVPAGIAAMLAVIVGSAV